MSFALPQFMQSPWNPLVWTALDNETDTRTNLIIYNGAANTFPTDTSQYDVNCIMMHQAEKQLYSNTGTIETPVWEAFGPNSALPNPLVPGTFLFTDGTTVYWSPALVGQVQYNASNLNQYGIINFNDFLVATNDVPNSRINVDLDTVALAGDATFISNLEGNLDLANIGGAIDLSTQVTGVLNSTNIDITALEGDLDLANIAGQIDLTTQVTGQLPAANIDVTDLATDAGFLAALIPELDENVKVAVDGVTITGDGTTANPLVAVGGGSGGTIISLTAGEDLAIGDTVGYATFINDTAMKAVFPKKSQDTGFTPAGSGNIFATANIGGNKWAMVIQGTVGTNTHSVVVGELNRDTNTWTFGTETESIGAVSTDGVCITKCDTDKFAINYSPDGNNNQVKCEVFTVSGLNVTRQGDATIFNDGDDRVYPVGVQLDTDIIAVLTSSASGQTNIFAINTSAGAPSVIDNFNATSALGRGNDGNWAIEVIDTNKVICVLADKASIYTFSGGFSGTWSAGANVVTLSNSITTLIKNGMKSVATDTAYLVGGNLSTNAFIILLTATGTTLAETDVHTETVTTGSYATVLSDGANAYFWTNLDGIYKIVNSGGNISLEQKIPIVMTGTYISNATGQIQNMFNESNLGYFINILGFRQSSNIFIDFHVQGMTPYFIGIAQNTVSRGGTARVLISGVDNNQTGLTAGSLYNAFEGGLVNTGTQGFNTVQAQSATSVKI